jgi:uncharacterized membrane protein HdeD (DUF308 family)
MYDLTPPAISGGTLRILWAFSARSLGKGLLTFALGTLTLFFGIVLHAIPALGAGVLTMVLGVSLILNGVVEIAAGFALTGGAWLLFGAAISMLALDGVKCSTSSQERGPWGRCSGSSCSSSAS